MSNRTTVLEIGITQPPSRPHRAQAPPSTTRSIPSTVWTDRIYFIIVVLILAGFIIILVVGINAWALKDKREHPDEKLEKVAVVVRGIYERYWRRG